MSDDILGRWIIHPSELDLVEKNYPLLPLARGKKLEQYKMIWTVVPNLQGF